MKNIYISAFAIFILSTSLAFAEDKVVLKDGRVLHGIIMEENKNKKIIRMDVFSESRNIRSNDIESIDKGVLEPLQDPASQNKDIKELQKKKSARAKPRSRGPDKKRFLEAQKKAIERQKAIEKMAIEQEESQHDEAPSKE